MAELIWDQHTRRYVGSTDDGRYVVEVDGDAMSEAIAEDGGDDIARQAFMDADTCCGKHLPAAARKRIMQVEAEQAERSGQG